MINRKILSKSGPWRRGDDCACVYLWWTARAAGSYSESAGVEVIRRHVADYIVQRDAGVHADYHNVFLANGASDAIKARITGVAFIEGGANWAVAQGPPRLRGLHKKNSKEIITQANTKILFETDNLE